MKDISSIMLSCELAVACISCNSSENKEAVTANDETQCLPVYNIPFSTTSTINKAQKKVLGFSASPRRGGNTDLLCDEFVRGAREAGGTVEKIILNDYIIDFFHEEHSVNPDTVMTEGDQAPMIVEKMTKADIIVLSSPVYYMNIDGQLKTLMDRCYRHKGLQGKEFYYITACADREESTAETAIFAFRGFVVCLPDPVERGCIKAIGMGRKGGVENTSYLTDAYEFGKTI